MPAADRPWWPRYQAFVAHMQAKNDGLFEPQPGLTEAQLLRLEARLAEWGVKTLPEGLRDLYRETAGFGGVARQYDVFSVAPRDDRSLEEIFEHNDEIWEITRLFKFGDIYSAALTCNRRGLWSIEPYHDEYERPKVFDMSFDEAMEAFLERMIETVMRRDRAEG